MRDFLIVGTGFYGAVVARELTNLGKSCLIIDQRKHIGGNCYTENKENINVHKYGPHIFHTNNESIWEYINQYAYFNKFIYRPKMISGEKVYSLPINVCLFKEIWGDKSDAELIECFNKSRRRFDDISNLENYAISTFGQNIYDIIIKNFTIKQWNQHPKNLPASIIQRLKVSFNKNERYFDDKYQGIPIGGYANIFIKMLDGIETRLNVDFFKDKAFWLKQAKHIIYTGRIDEFFDCCFGKLEYKTRVFKEHFIENNGQNEAVMQYANLDVPFSRVVDHKQFEFGKQKHSIVSYEYPTKYTQDSIPLYPVNDNINNSLYKKYKFLSSIRQNVTFGGRLGDYKYYDMEHVIALAIKKAKELCPS